MNERIRELAKQAGIITEVWHKDSLGHGYKTPNYEAEKFAELIVRECIDIVDAQWEPVLVEKIREHFGVE